MASDRFIGSRTRRCQRYQRNFRYWHRIRWSKLCPIPFCQNPYDDKSFNSAQSMWLSLWGETNQQRPSKRVSTGGSAILNSKRQNSALFTVVWGKAMPSSAQELEQKAKWGQTLEWARSGGSRECLTKNVDIFSWGGGGGGGFVLIGGEYRGQSIEDSCHPFLF